MTGAAPCRSSSSSSDSGSEEPEPLTISVSSPALDTAKRAGGAAVLYGRGLAAADPSLEVKSGGCGLICHHQGLDVSRDQVFGGIACTVHCTTHFRRVDVGLPSPALTQAMARVEREKIHLSDLCRLRGGLRLSCTRAPLRRGCTASRRSRHSAIRLARCITATL